MMIFNKNNDLSSLRLQHAELMFSFISFTLLM